MSLTFNHSTKPVILELHFNHHLCCWPLHAIGQSSPPFQSSLCNFPRYVLLFCLERWPFFLTQPRCRFSGNASLTPTDTHPETGLCLPLHPVVASTAALTSVCFNHLFTLPYWKLFKAKDLVMVRNT